MTKSFKMKMISIIVAVAIIISVIIVGALLIAPRKLTSIAGTGKLENVSAIVYRSSPCCGYNEGAEYEATITDMATIERVVAQFNSEKMKWSLPMMMSGGSNLEVTFRRANGDKSVKFSNGKIGNFEFTDKQNLLNTLISAVARPNIYIRGNYNTNINCDFLIIDSYEKYQNFVGTIKDYDSEQDGIDVNFFARSKAIVVNLGEGSSSRKFFLTKITQTDKGAYLIKLENMQRGENSTDDIMTRAALLSVPIELDTTKLSFEIT